MVQQLMLLYWTLANENVDHAKLFQQLLDASLPPGIVELLAVWYGRS